MAMDESECVDVKFSNLPKDFYENLFLSQLRGKLSLKRSRSSLNKEILSCVYDKPSRSVVVKFASPELASKIVETQMDFLSTTLLVEKQPSIASDDTIYEKDTDSEDEVPANRVHEDVINSPVRKKIDVRSTPLKEKLLTSRTTNLNSFFKNLSFIPQLTKEVTVSNLPEDFNEVNVLFVINNALHRNKFCERTIKPAKECKKTGDSTAVVEFTSVEAATETCSLTIDYGDDILKLVQEEIFPEPTPLPELSSTVKVSGLPMYFEVVNVLFVINNALHKNKFCGRTIKPAKVCKKTGDSTAVVEFTSVEAATETCSLTIDYGDDILKLVQEEIFPEPTPLPELSSTVKVSGLPIDFEVLNVLFVLNEALYAQSFCKRPEKPAEACKKTSEKTASVEFSSVAAASEICSGPVYYGEDLLVLDQVSEAPKQSDCPSMYVSEPYDWNDSDILQLSDVKNSDTVQITGVTSSYTSDTFKKFLFDEMKEANFLTEDDFGAIVKCNYNLSTKTAVVQFSTSEEATLATHLTNLKVTKLVLDDNGNECLPGSDEDGEGQLLLEHDEGFKYFLKVLARKRGDIPKSGSHDNFLDTLTGYMEKRGVKTNINEMRKKKATMRENFRRWKSNNNEFHPLFKVHSVIFDPAVKQGILKGSVYEWNAEDEDLLQEPEGSDKFLDDLIKFSDSAAASWTFNAELALVQACIDNRTEYSKPQRHITFWRSISAQLYQEKFIYGPQKCENKMESLSKMYKDYCDEAAATGARGPFEMIRDKQTRDLMDIMHELKRKDVGSHPKHIQGAGIQLVHQKESPEGTGTGVFRGRTRPSSLPRDKSMKELKLEVEKGKLSLIQKMAQKLDGK